MDILRSPAQVYKLHTALGFGLNFYLVKTTTTVLFLYIAMPLFPALKFHSGTDALGAFVGAGASGHRLVTADSSCPFPSSHSMMTHWWHEIGHGESMRTTELGKHYEQEHCAPENWVTAQHLHLV